MSSEDIDLEAIAERISSDGNGDGGGGLPSTVNREGREKLRDLDTDDPDDTVYLGESIASSGHYHDSRECSILRGSEKGDDPVKVTRSGAKRRWNVPCKNCVLGEYDER